MPYANASAVGNDVFFSYPRQRRPTSAAKLAAAFQALGIVVLLDRDILLGGIKVAQGIEGEIDGARRVIVR